MVTSQMVTLCYGQIAMIEASGAFFAYLVVYVKHGNQHQLMISGIVMDKNGHMNKGKMFHHFALF
jgi:hypothetical protein